VDQIEFKTELLIFFSILAFCITSLLRLNPMPRLFVPSPLSHSSAGKWCMVAYCTVLLPVFYHDIARLAGDNSALIASARIATVQLMRAGENPYSNKLSSTSSTTMTFLIIALIVDRKRASSRSLLVFASLLTVAYSILTTGRQMFLQVLLGTAVAYLLPKGKLPFTSGVKKLSPVLATFVVIFILMQLFAKFQSSENDNVGQYLKEQTIGYLVGGIPALDASIRHKVDPGNDVFGLFQQWGTAVGIPYDKRDPSPPYAEVPFPTNVYTALQPYYSLCGYAGPILFFAILGLVYGYLYGASCRGPIGLFFYSVMVLPLFMTLFSDTYMSTLLLRDLQLCIFAFLYFGVLRRIPAVSLGLLTSKAQSKTSKLNPARFVYPGRSS
jgi:oligosaccharide repeat unit polymerase